MMPTPQADSSPAALQQRPKVGVGVALLRSSDLRLLVGVRKGSHGSGVIAFPGGHLENGESWAYCAAREVEEETGLRIDESRLSLSGVTNDVMPGGLHYVTIFMMAKLTDDEAARVQNTEPHKCEGWEWITLEDMFSRPMFTSLANFIRDGHAARLL